MQLDFSSFCAEKLKYIKTEIDKLFVCVMVVHKDTSGLPGADTLLKACRLKTSTHFFFQNVFWFIIFVLLFIYLY